MDARGQMQEQATWRRASTATAGWSSLVVESQVATSAVAALPFSELLRRGPFVCQLGGRAEWPFDTYVRQGEQGVAPRSWTTGPCPSQLMLWPEGANVALTRGGSTCWL